MKTVDEINEKIANYKSELEEIIRVKEHCASMKWWPVVTELKKLENVRNRDKRQLEAILE